MFNLISNLLTSNDELTLQGLLEVLETERKIFSTNDLSRYKKMTKESNYE